MSRITLPRSHPYYEWAVRQPRMRYTPANSAPSGGGVAEKPLYWEKSAIPLRGWRWLCVLWSKGMGMGGTEYREIVAHRDAMTRALATELGGDTATRVVDVLLERARRMEEDEVRAACCAADPAGCDVHGPLLEELKP